VLDRAVLAGGVHPLEDQQERPPVLGVELLLQVPEDLDVPREALACAALRGEASGLPGVDRRQAETPAVVDPEGSEEVAEVTHRGTSLARGLRSGGTRMWDRNAHAGTGRGLPGRRVADGIMRVR
jgi:hypothetical protein